MQPSHHLAALWRAHARVRLVVPDEPTELEQLLYEAFEAARAPWPSVALSPDQFVRHLAERLPKAREGSPLERLLGQLHLAELYLACACAAGIDPAIALFEQHHLAKLRGRLGRRVPAALIDDVCQLVREKLLVRTGQRTPHIATYTGEGALQNFVHVIGLRTAQKLRGADRPGPEEDVDVALNALPAPGVDAELDFIKRALHGQLRPAVRDACAKLSADEQHLLKLHYGRGLSTSKLAPLFDVNQSTISRRLEGVRRKLYQETKKSLRERLHLSERDFESLLALLESQLDMSLSQVFGNEDEDDE